MEHGVNKAAQIARERGTYNITVLGPGETRWKLSGQVRLNTGEIMMYSEHEEEDAHHTEGVALMLSHEAQKALISCEGSSMRLSKQRKKPSSSASFSATHTQTTILVGDLNAKIGSDNSGYEEVMGKQGLGRMNENGEMLADVFAFNNMIIGGSVFPHRRIHKATWVSPDHRTENQIDHICIERTFGRSMQDVTLQGHM